MPITKLILERCEEESVTVDGPCRIVVTEIRGRRVKLLFVADRAVRIERSELAQENRKEPT